MYRTPSGMDNYVIGLMNVHYIHSIPKMLHLIYFLSLSTLTDIYCVQYIH
jgi:hypothetical protein